MILAAGRGTRLGALTEHTPKPLLLLDRHTPLIVHQLRQLAAAGVREVIINLHHLGDLIEARLGDGQALGLRLRYSRETELLETGGGLVQALPLLGTDPFWLLNGDILTDFDFNRLPRSLAADRDMHLIVTPRPAFRERGDFQLEGDRITRNGADFVYCGIAVVHPGLLQGRRPEPFSLREPLFDACDRGRVSGQRHDGYWNDIGSPAQLEAARNDWRQRLRSQAPGPRGR